MRRAGPVVVGGAGAVLAILGVVVFALANSASTAGLGWTAYAPLAPADAHTSELTVTFSDGSVLWTRQHAVGAGLVVLGLLLLAALAGWWLGRRTGRARPE